MQKNEQVVPAEVLALAEEHGIDLDALELTNDALDLVAAGGKPPGRNGRGGGGGGGGGRGGGGGGGRGGRR